MPCTVPSCPTRPHLNSSARPCSLPSSTTTPALCPTPSSTGTSSSRAWKTASNVPSPATAARWPSMPTRAPSIAPNSSILACATLGIQRILAKPYSPQAKGKIERFFGFVRSDFLARAGPLRLGPHPRRTQPQLPGLAGGRLPPQGPLRDRPVAPRPLPPGRDPGRAHRRPPHPAQRLPLPRHPPGDQDRPRQLSRATATASPATWSARRSNCATTPSTWPTSKSGTTASTWNRLSPSISRPLSSPGSRPILCHRRHRPPASITWPCCVRSTSSSCASNCRPSPSPA